jgi:hypothetical protein
MFNSLFSFLTFLLFSPFRLVRSNTWVPWKLLTHERSIDLGLQTFPKLLLLLVPKVTTHSLYPECIANLKLPIDAFYRESRSGVNTLYKRCTRWNCISLLSVYWHGPSKEVCFRWVFVILYPITIQTIIRKYLMCLYML